MPVFTRKPVLVNAVRWYKNGDHPEDHSEMIHPSPYSTLQFEPFLSEGKVVQYFRNPGIPAGRACEHCHKTMHEHGWIDVPPGGGHTVCPGDWVVTEEKGKHWPVKDQVFRALYESVEEKLFCPYCGLGIKTPLTMTRTTTTCLTTKTRAPGSIGVPAGESSCWTALPLFR